MSMTREQALAFFDWETAEWKKNIRVVKNKYIYEYSFSVKYKKSFFHHTFARIKSTNDVRWRFWRNPSHYFAVVEMEGPLEGVCQELHEAKAKALEGLPVCISQLS